MMKKVLFRAPVLTQSGYGVHARQVARWLLSLADAGTIDLVFEPLMWGTTPWYVDHEACDGLVGQVLKRALTPQHSDFDISFQLQLPNEWNPMLAEYNIGISAVVESDTCNPAWVFACNNMDHVIVPSEHSKQALLNTAQKSNVGLDVDISVIGESFSDAILELIQDPSKRVDIPALDEVETDTNLLVFGQLCGNNPENDRKNLGYTIKYICEALADRSDVGVIIKTNAGRNTNTDFQKVKDLFKNIISQVKVGNGPNFHILHGHMTDKEVASLYAHPKLSALVSFTRGEGFGLPLLEAAALGLPVIATNWSAHKEFLGKGKFIGVDYDLSEVHASRVDGSIWMEGTRWANVKEDEAKKAIQKFVGSQDKPKEWAEELSQIIFEQYSPRAIEDSYGELAYELSLFKEE